MFIYLNIFIFVTLASISDAGYGTGQSYGQEAELSDVEAPAYVPSYLKNKYYGTKTGPGNSASGYTGTKTGYGGSGYSKTSYGGTKTGYAGTKTGYAGTKTGYGGTKPGYGDTKSSYTGSKSWSYGSNQPNFESFKENANKEFAPICEPECRNNGICVATGTCHCPPNFSGSFCQLEKKPCLTFPPLPMNSKRKCTTELCTITCMEGHQFPDGYTNANMRCVDGQWQPSRADLTNIPDCNPTCSPPCLNGGACLSLNTCQCAQDYRGPQCQYAASVCDVRKLGFNGAYNCFGDGEKFTCKLNCPSGAKYSTTPAESYTCLYSTGVFQPQPIPKCEFEPNVIVIEPIGHHKEYNSSQTYYETHYESSHGKATNDLNYGSYGHGIYGQNSQGHGVSSQGHTGQSTYGGGGSMQVVIEDLSPKPGNCFTWGGSHYKTFDGKIYSFQSHCQHILVRDAKDHKFTVAIRQGDCKRQYYCPSELTVFLEDKEYVLAVGEEGGVTFRSTKRLLPIPAMLPGIRVTMPRDTVLVTLDTLGVTIKWDTNNLVMVEASVVLWNNTEGLCGRLNGISEDDLITKEGKLTNSKATLASSWQLNKIGDMCEGSPREISTCEKQPLSVKKMAQEFCVSTFNKEKFRKCSKILDVALLVEACQWDYCSCASNQNSEECACTTVNVYARECLAHGVEDMKKWRDPQTCPMKCPEGKIYNSCGPDSPPTCSSPLVSLTSDNSTCTEGCFCPEGLMLEEGRCLPEDQCPCRLRAKSFPPGSVVPKDCNTCTCQAGKWTCTQVPCGARCGAVGDPHYTTFDGLRYDFMGHCTYTLLDTTNLTVEVENVACSGAISEAMNLSPHTGAGKPSCTKAVTIRYGGAIINLKQGGFILVNGKEVSKLPVNVGDVLIRAASSLFIIVQLPNKIDLWWDGNTRVFVDVPPEFHGMTKGLCGTFNLNQKDDFVTPEGDIEQSALAFANKWKTREFCDDIQMTEPEHPCKENVENKATAEKYCGKLKSKLFESCRWYVDVEPYYEECLYDMCACEGDISRCLCPILGDYAMACAKSGVQIQWRYNVKECELLCTGGQSYTVCADSCRRTCSDISLSISGVCKPSCVEGCACAPGNVLDETNECVPVGLCPCYHKGMKFNPGYKEVRPGRRERGLCTCTGAQWDCKPATDDDIKKFPPAEDLKLNCSAALNQEFTTCVIPEPLTCKNMHLSFSPTTAECRPGCQCIGGTVWDVGTNRCIVPDQCPCHHGGVSYPDGHQMVEDCNTCECKRGNWTCTQRKCSGVCSAWGDSHFTTFDGKDYDFQGVCTYLMAKGVMETGKDGFVVEIQNVPCGTTGATCSKSISLKVGHGDSEEIVVLTKDAPLPDVKSLKRIKLRLAGSFVFLDVPSLAVSLQWDRGTRVYVKVDPMWANRVKGLCGNYNMDIRDDFQTPSGGGIAESSALIFADSWKLKQTCPKPEDIRDHCVQHPERKDWAISTCGKMKRPPFSLCHSEVSPTPYITRCERDACACDSGDDCACACTALAAYAQHCASRGVDVKWRTNELCPMQCDEECSNYNACISPCPPENCDNTLNYEEVKRSCEKDSCVEGCKPKETCAEGLIYKNDTSKECVPRSLCRPTCMTIDGKDILEGEVLEEDACHTCICSQKQKVCTGLPCSTQVPTMPTLIFPTVSNEPMRCVTGWTAWVNRNHPETKNGESVDTEPLPQRKDFQIGSPMCSPDKVKEINCRTVGTHRTAKETGLNVECSLERGLVCKETGVLCPDFEIRVLCQCEEVNTTTTVTAVPITTTSDSDIFQCDDPMHPNHPHPTDCHQFYECTPENTPNKYHAVLKTCGSSMMYNPQLMVCDWPASVIKIRPECGNTTEEVKITTHLPILTTVSEPVTPKDQCDARNQTYVACAYECDKLCDHFKKELNAHGKCLPGEKCVEGCLDESLLNIKCDVGSRWRDLSTCVPIKDCTCYGQNGRQIKPNDIDIQDCIKCQCLDNRMHCDNSECVNIISPTYSPVRREPLMSTEIDFTTPPTTLIIIKTTVSPPPVCSEDRYVDLIWPQFDDSIKLTASSSVSSSFGPDKAELNGTTTVNSAGSWNPAVQNKQQYLQVELPRREPIYGVKMQGSPLYDQYVTSYEIMYGDDGNIFHTVGGVDGNPKVFRGPVNPKSITKQMIEPPIEAKFVRIMPLTWHDDIAIRMELIGCETVDNTTHIDDVFVTESPICIEPLGLEGGLPESNIEVSSKTEDIKFLDLDKERGWKPLYSTPGEWIMWDLTGPRNITGIRTKGGNSGWVTGYHIMYSSDLNTFHAVSESDGSRTLFPGNFDGLSAVRNDLKPPVRARYFKLLPVTWHSSVELHAEPIGCFETYLITTTISQSTFETKFPVTGTTSASCQLCPGVLGPSNGDCRCSGTFYYDGEGCSERAQCPCIVGFMSYGVGATFRGSNCDECVCKLGGLTHCKPVKECTCQGYLLPKLTSNCQCICEECPPGQRLCPTSQSCLPDEKWCDGVQDCADDERNCEFSTTVGIQTSVVPTVGAIVTTTTAAPIVKECPRVECPPGYHVVVTSVTPSYKSSGMTDLPPPRPRKTYQRYFKGGPGTKTGYSSTGFSKTGFSKTGYGTKSTYVPSPPPKTNQAFTLDKPKLEDMPDKAVECVQFKCVPKLPEFPRGGATPAVCSTPKCPPEYTLQLDTSGKKARNQCPQYVCVPPPERPVFCNVTGRTFNTFDGAEYKYDVCFHILARENRIDSWTILVRKKCRVDSCLNELIVRQDEELILIKPSMMIEYDNYEYSIEQTSMICFQKNSFDISRLGNGLAIKSRRYNFTVFYYSTGDVKIGVLKSQMGTIDGLCGTFDGDTSNERRLPDGTLAVSIEQFGRGWARPGLSPTACQTKVIPPEKQKKVWDLCDVITKEPLSRCDKVLNLDKWRSICLEKVCECADLVVNGTKMTDEECRCLLLDQFISECLAGDKDLDLGNWRTDLKCPADCPAPLVHYDCYRKRCEPSCSTMGSIITQCPVEDGQCFPGCYCPGGKLRKGDICVTPTECRDCVCNGVGSPAKYVTFERDDLPFGGNCTYLAARDRNLTGHHKFQVFASNGPCEENHNMVCTNSIHLVYEKNVLRIQKDKNIQKLVATINGAPVYKYPVKNEWMTMTQLAGHDVTVLVPDVQLELSVLESKLEFSVRVPSYTYANQTEGLCGVCAGYQEQLLMQNGTTTDILDLYGKSWQASPKEMELLELPQQDECWEKEVKCVIPPPEEDICYNIYNKEKFGACHALVDPETFVQSCQQEVCANNKTDLCNVLERYAAECRRVGVCLSWRTNDMCSLVCESPLVYRPCVDCPRTCDNYDLLSKDPGKCDKPVAEGCFCPEDKVRVNNTCIEPAKCFPCDAENHHYAGDQWQEDACTTCKCSKLSSENAAHVLCTTQSCTTPVCDLDHVLVTKSEDSHSCCPEYACVPKPQDQVSCDEPKKISCGFGQVLKQKTNPNGCKEFACECKPPSACDPLSTNDSEMLEPGMIRETDTSGCCPVATLVCKPSTCPPAKDCPKYHQLKNVTLPGMCCPKYECELPKDKCIITLQWEAAPKGGEKSRVAPETMLKDVESVWLDGPCRTCTCLVTAGVPETSCSTDQCAPITSTPDYVLEPRLVPFTCCPIAVARACRYKDNIYKVGENWTNPDDVCETYKCVEVEDGKLKKVTTLKTCDLNCQPGWEYFPPSSSSQECCGVCKPVACVVDGKERKINEKWTSADHCTNYTCVDLHGTLQVQSQNETCPQMEEGWADKFVVKQKKDPGQCCVTYEAVACKVDNITYAEGETWLTSDPCKNSTCVRTASSSLTVTLSTETCASCPRGHKRVPRPHSCCGHCEPDACVVQGELKLPGSTWQSEDNCTQYSCLAADGTMLVTASAATCPDVSACAAADLVDDGCCQKCIETPLSHSTCMPEPLSNDGSRGIMRIKLGHHGYCVNKGPLKEFKECRGACASGTVYNNQTGSHDSRCECCTATRYEPLLVTLHCDDGSQQKHRVASPVTCRCMKCGHINTDQDEYGTKGNKYSQRDYEFPEIDARFKETRRRK